MVIRHWYKRQKWIKWLFFALLAKPLVFITLGLNSRNRHCLPLNGPAILVANHTSHLDTIVLMSLFPLSQIHKIRPVAAADYFFKNKWIRWFAIHCIDIIPMRRHEKLSKIELFKHCFDALDQGDILILFPEGTRSSTEDRVFQLKRGIHVLLKERPQTVVLPVLLRGLGRVLPKGEALLVPFNCDVIIDHEFLSYHDNAEVFLSSLEARYHYLLSYCVTK